MQKNIVFVTSCIQPRGVEKALMGMLDYIPRNSFNITLVLVETGGEYMDMIPDDVHVIQMPVPTQVRYDVNHGATAKKILSELLRKVTYFRQPR